ncbi:phosphotransferase [Microbacterium sp. ARD31]|uniref:phosphotransferase family protein n=1 Tax=Microbacterium sp. ARD31 TaxID=2962576 RepID=UPI002881DCA2|nr:phosphotransferase [Microbacterium sp. ARD31]MDT0186752.1 phosphotransferase [Microbacterium sp. ARD31]
MDTTVESSSARLLGFDGWDTFATLAGGRGGAHLAWRDGVAHVVKAYPSDDGLRGARERAALSALDGAAGTPSLLAEGDDPPMVVMTHLDGTGSLADALLGADAPAARRALTLWAQALAGLHAAGTSDTRTAFVEALAARAPQLEPRTLAGDFRVAADRYADVLHELGLPPHPEALDDLRRLPSRLADPRHEVLSPADTCPDNNVLTTGRAHLLDFEYAELRHRAWDVAYLYAPWPSCWCAWMLPHDAAEAAVSAYRQAAGTAVDDATFGADLSLATLGWRAMTPAWFIAGALAGADPTGDARRPSRRAFVLHRLAAVAGNDDHPALAAMAADLHSALRERWGTVPLDLAPAFRR